MTCSAGGRIFAAPSFRQRLKALEGCYFYVDVWNCRARLALMHNTGDGGGRSEVIEDFDSALLEKAVYQAGGMINLSGWYPLSNTLKTLLRKRLGMQETDGES